MNRYITEPDLDDYSEIINGHNTYKWIVDRLHNSGSVMFGWSDGDMTHLDILVCTPGDGMQNLQSGLRLSDLYVACLEGACLGLRRAGIIPVPVISVKN